MNLLENEEVNARDKKTKTIMTIIIVAILLLVVLCIILVCMMNNIQKNMLKINVDTKSITKVAEDIFVIEDNTIYVSIKDFAPLIGYEVYNGDHTSEDAKKGYIQNEYEEASFSLDSNKIYKTQINQSDNEYFDIEKPVKLINNKLYISAEGMQIAGNCAISYNQKNNQYTAFSLSYLAQYYTSKITDASIEDFNNQKALLYNMIIVKNANGNFGVRSLDGKEIIGTKYASIKFVESSKDFIVTTSDRKMGILACDGSTKVQPTYDEIKQIDKDLNLYLVKNNNKYGVINQSGNTIIHSEYDKIGIDVAQFDKNDIKNPYLLFENCIPVQKDKKWGIYDKTGKLILPIEYDEIGCINTEKNNNLLVIPEYEVIIVGQNKKYGMYDKTGKVILPCVLDSVYLTINAGQKEYYMKQGESGEIEVINYLETYVLKPNEEMNIVNNETTNTTVNETANTIAESTVNEVNATINSNEVVDTSTTPTSNEVNSITDEQNTTSTVSTNVTSSNVVTQGTVLQ